MRATISAVAIVSFLAVLLAFAITPVVAQMSTDPAMEKPGTTEMHKGKTAGEPEKEFSGEAKSGTSREEKARDEMKARMKGEEKAKVESEPKAKASSEAESKMKEKAEAEKEVGKKPEARTFKERDPGIKERKEMGAKREGAEKADVSRQAKTQEAQVKAGEAVVVRVDRPDNCLRIRSEASASADVIGCASSGEKLRLTGVFSRDGRWAQLDNNGWVFFDQLQTDVRPESTASEGSWERPAAKGDGKPGKRPQRGMPHYFHGDFCPGWYPGYSWYGY